MQGRTGIGTGEAHRVIGRGCSLLAAMLVCALIATPALSPAGAADIPQPVPYATAWHLAMQRVAGRAIGASCASDAQCNTRSCVALQCVCATDAHCGGDRRCVVPADGPPVCRP